MIRTREDPVQAEGYTWCFNKCFLFDFLILVFSEKALASSNSFLRVAERKAAGERFALNNKPSQADPDNGDERCQARMLPL